MYMKNQYSIIIVDDEWLIRSNLSQLFPWDEMGFTVKGIFENGLKALSFIALEKVDVILTDIRMPIMDGLELANRAKTLDNDMQVVLLSAFDDFSYAQKAIEYSAFDYLVKPVSYNELIECFNSLHKKLDDTRCFQKQELTTSLFETYLKNNIMSFDLKNAANHFQTTPNQLKKWIEEEYSNTIPNIINKVKMSKAKEMLDITGTRIFEIAKALGYSNSNNFTRAFIAYCKISPTDYRNRK